MEEEVPPTLAPGDVPVGTELPGVLQGTEKREEEDTLLDPHADNVRVWWQKDTEWSTSLAVMSSTLGACSPTSKVVESKRFLGAGLPDAALNTLVGKTWRLRSKLTLGYSTEPTAWSED